MGKSIPTTPLAKAIRPADGKTASPTARILRKLLRDKAAVFTAALLLLIILAVVLAPLLAPNDPFRGQIRERLQTPSGAHLLGTDEQGRDILSRLLYGGRLTFFAGIVAVSIGLGAGGLIGVLSGFYKRFDMIVMRFMDVMFSFPAILIAMAIVGALGPGFESVVYAVGISTIPAFARIARSSAIGVANQDYVQAGQALGLKDHHLILRYIFPNSFAPILVYTTLQLGQTILLVAALSFLGLGVQPPAAEWGSMASQGRNFLFMAPHVSTIPSFAVFVTVLCFNVIGDSLRDALDPRTRVG